MNSYIEFPYLAIKLYIDRVAFYIGSMPIYWYGLIIGLGLVLGTAVAICLGKRFGVTSDTLCDILLWGIPSAIVCARLYYVIFEFDQYKNNFAAVFNIRNGGIAIYGAVIGCVCSTLVYCRKKRLDTARVIDVCSVGLVIGQIIGRWGNFTNQEAFGKNTTLPWGMTGSGIIKSLEAMKESGLPVNPDLPVHPTFLYESIWNLCVLAVMLFVIFRYYKFNGQIFGTYISLYGLGRVWIEGLRTDSLYLGSVRVSQLVAAMCVIAGTCFVIRGINRSRKNPEKEK